MSMRGVDAAERARAWMARTNAMRSTPDQRRIAIRAHRRYAEMHAREDQTV